MKFSLIKQLLVVSLCTLLLPWTGCQYVREMETLIRQQQSETLLAFTKPLAENVKQQALFQELITSQADSLQPFFAPQAKAAHVIDGYDDEWLSFYQRKIKHLKSQAKTTLKTNTHGDHLYIFLQVEDSEITYFDPTQSMLVTHDWIRINTPEGEYQLFTSAPGSAQIFFKAKNKRESQSFHDITAHWQESANSSQSGYQVEIKVPLPLVEQGLSIDIINKEQERPRVVASTSEKPTPLLIPSDQLTQWLEPFNQGNWDLQVVNQQGWPLLHHANEHAEVNLPLVTRENLGRLLMNRIYRFFLEATLPVNYAQQWPLNTTQLSHLNRRIKVEKLLPAANQSFHQWYALNESNQSVLLVIQPIITANQVLGYVIATQTENALLSFTNDALRRVMNLSLLTFLLVVMILLGFAIGISLRIKKLKAQTEAAINEDGSITPFKASQGIDELGELKSSYAQLLWRIKNYNDYLQSLTHKLAHEIRTPLAIVKSSLEMLDTVPKEEQHTYLERALEGNQRLATMLNAMSESTQVEQLVQNTEFHALNLAELIENLCQAYQIAYPDYQFKFFHEEPDADSSSITGNPELLAQMVDKLVDNARDFSDPAHPIEIHLKSQGAEQLIQVVNQGPSLPEQMSGQLFDSLISVRDKSQSQGTHLGLGLHIVRLIANAHQGSVSAGNLSNGAGVCFTVSLPGSSA